jgi:hypothetical protein
MKEICGLFLNEMLISNGISESLASEAFGEELKKLYDKMLWMYVEDLTNTQSKAANPPNAPGASSSNNESADNKENVN